MLDRYGRCKACAGRKSPSDRISVRRGVESLLTGQISSGEPARTSLRASRHHPLAGREGSNALPLGHVQLHMPRGEFSLNESRTDLRLGPQAEHDVGQMDPELRRLCDWRVPPSWARAEPLFSIPGGSCKHPTDLSLHGPTPPHRCAAAQSRKGNTL